MTRMRATRTIQSSMPAEKLVGDRSRHAVNRIDTLRSWVVEQGQS